MWLEDAPNTKGWKEQENGTVSMTRADSLEWHIRYRC